MKNWREKFLAALDAHAVNKSKLAELIGVDPRTMQRWTRRDADLEEDVPSVFHAIKIAEVLRMSVDEIFRGPEVFDVLESVHRLIVAPAENSPAESPERVAGTAGTSK